jgi:hypothetical protein
MDISTETECVYSAVRAESLHEMYGYVGLQMVKSFGTCNDLQQIQNPFSRQVFLCCGTMDTILNIFKHFNVDPSGRAV